MTTAQRTRRKDARDVQWKASDQSAVLYYSCPICSSSIRINIVFEKTKIDDQPHYHHNVYIICWLSLSSLLNISIIITSIPFFALCYIQTICENLEFFLRLASLDYSSVHLSINDYDWLVEFLQPSSSKKRHDAVNQDKYTFSLLNFLWISKAQKKS